MTDLPIRFSLSGADWLLKDYVGEDWLGRRPHHFDTRDVRGWRPATVPGSIQHDLWRAGEVPNPYFERNSLLLEWIPQRTWVYKKRFHADPAWQGCHVRLVLEGIDYSGRVYLNGDLLGAPSGMFVPAVFDIGDRLRYGEDNLLAVVLDPAPLEQPQVGYTSRVQTAKARMNYWWDFCPRMIHVGLWDHVYLDITGPVWIESVFVRPRLGPPFAQADVDVNVELAGVGPAALEVTLLDGEHEVAQQAVSAPLDEGRASVAVSLPIESVRLWWPNGQGEQPLYTAQVTVRGAGGEPLDVALVSFGVRHLALAPNSSADPAARPYTLAVNGRPTYIQGWNWVPLDALYGVERPEKLERLLTLAQRAHVNMLRVWGGGLIEREPFYTLCDRLGLLVWQDFIQSSSGIDNAPSATPEYLGLLTHTARHAIRRRRNHLSLALWCGGNELQASGNQPLDERHPALAALRQVVAELDPDRLWLPTSSSGPVFGNTLAAIRANPLSLHDVHGPYEHQGLERHYELYNAGTSLLHSEFGVEGITNQKALDAVIAPEHQWPVSLDNPLWHHLGAWWVKEPRWREMLGAVGDVATLARAVRMLQCEGLRYAVEANRRRQFQNSGSLPWQFNEPYPMAACTSAVDYFGQPKPVYYGVANAYLPVHVTARFARQAWPDHTEFAAEVWANNALPRAFAGARLEAALVGLTGRRHATAEAEAGIAANAASLLRAIAWPLAPVDEPVFFLDLRLTDAAGAVLSLNRYIFTRAADLSPLLAAPPAQLAARLDVTGDTGALAVANRGANAALFIWVEEERPVEASGGAFFGDNHFCLLPGEERVIAVEWRGVPPGQRRLSLGGWNTNRVAL